MFALVFAAVCAAQDLRAVPGPWDNRVAVLAGRGDDGADLTMHYLVAGPPDAPAVVLLHGFPDFSYGWRHVIPLLSQDFRVYAPDLRGYAGTDAPRRGYDLDVLGGDVTAFLDVIGPVDGRDPAAPVHLIGHDWGATVGWRAVNDAPDRFLTWTALDVPHIRSLAAYLDESREQRKYRRFLAQLLAPLAPTILAGLGPERRARIAYREELVNDAALSDADIAWYQAAWDERREVIGPLRYYRRIVYHRRPVERYYEDAPAISVPTLVLWGAEDHYMLSPMAARSCEEVSARCASEVFPGAGHYLHWDLPEAVVGRWRAFVAGG